MASLPADPDRVAEYVAEAANLVGESGRAVFAPSTLARWVAGLNAVHRAAGFPAPGEDPGVKATLRGIRRTARRPPRRAKPAGLDLLRPALAAIDTEHWQAAVIGRRDIAMLLLGFAGALRRSDLAGLRLSDVEFDDGALAVRIRSSKTDQEAAGQSVGYPRGTHRGTCVACAVLDWAAVLHADATGGRVGVLRLLSVTGVGRRGHACTDPDQLRMWRELLEAEGEAPLLRPVTKAATTLDGRTAKDLNNHAYPNKYPAGFAITVVCQDSGPSAYGSTVWDETSDGLWVTDYYVHTGPRS